MTFYNPDNWVILKIKGDTPHYRVLAGWNDSYLTGDNWRVNSGIISVQEDKEAYYFVGYSGSTYCCTKASYEMRNNISVAWNSFQQSFENEIEIMPPETDWLALDLLIKQ